MAGFHQYYCRAMPGWNAIFILIFYSFSFFTLLYDRVYIAILQGFFMQKDYKMFPPSVNWDNIEWSTRRPIMDFPIQAFTWFYPLFFFLNNVCNYGSIRINMDLVCESVICWFRVNCFKANISWSILVDLLTVCNMLPGRHQCDKAWKG